MEMPATIDDKKGGYAMFDFPGSLRFQWTIVTIASHVAPLISRQLGSTVDVCVDLLAIYSTHEDGTLWKFRIAIENHHFKWDHYFDWAIFNSKLLVITKGLNIGDGPIKKNHRNIQPVAAESPR